MVNWASSLMHEPEDVKLLSIYNSDNYLDFPDTAGAGQDPPELLLPVLGGDYPMPGIEPELAACNCFAYVLQLELLPQPLQELIYQAEE